MAGAVPISIRAGRYVSQPTGYRAFIPAPLSPDPGLDLRGELPGLLSQAPAAREYPIRPARRVPTPARAVTARRDPSVQRLAKCGSAHSVAPQFERPVRFRRSQSSHGVPCGFRAKILCENEDSRFAFKEQFGCPRISGTVFPSRTLMTT